MSSGYTFETKENYLVMHVTGNYDYWQFIRYPDLIRTQCERDNIYRVLVDLMAVTYKELPTIELFFLGEKLAESLRDRIKTALVWGDDTHDYFLETVATNRAALIRIFQNGEAARNWLLFDHEDEPFSFLKT